MEKYTKMPKVEISARQWPDKDIETSPSWCAVDLRDGNQALPNPMTPHQKKRYFKLLVDMGFKEIEVGFPSASADDFQFTRDLIEQNMIPEDVTISVLTQARPHLIEKTIESLKGVKKAVIHVYIATSKLHMKYVFGMEEGDASETIVKAIKQIREGADNELADSEIGLEFSPEEFTDTRLQFAVDICDAAIEAWQPAPGEKVILNLPATVERRPPHHYADMVEEFIRRMKHHDQSIISLHAHNDMGCAVAATQLALQAGATRVEGTLFGHGERTGNVDLVTLILNLQYMGVETGIDFRKLDEITDLVAELTGFTPHPRHPYAGELVFTAFSGSHQDAIHKGMTNKDSLVDDFGHWKIPYLHVNPSDLGRSFEKFIRINSQSGKGGITHILHTEYGVRIPRYLQVEFAQHVQKYADEQQRELSPEEVWEIFKANYDVQDAPIALHKYWPRPTIDNPAIIEGEVHLDYNGVRHELRASGNGPIDAFVQALNQLEINKFTLINFDEAALGHSSDAEAVSVIQLQMDEKTAIGIGFGDNIDQAAVRSIISALNKLLA